MNENERFEKILEKVQKAPRYTGGEMNTAVKGWDDCPLHFGFCFPDTYEVGMSHLGLKILYGLINREEWSLCERFFMPWTDMIALMKEENLPLLSTESRHPMHEFDVIGFTLQYEMSYTNILAMLDMGGIPLEGKDRGESDPIVVAGGPCAFNPEPLADFIDAFMIGDGEDVMTELNRVILERKEKGLSRKECLRKLADLEGVYVPSFYDVEYDASGIITGIHPNTPGVPETIRKRVVTDLNQTYYPEEIPVPYTEVVFDRIMLEIMRGCTRGCRFCQAGMLYRPVRERSLEKLIDLSEKLVASTGYEEISLSSLSSGDYTCLPELIRELMRRMKDKRVSISLPSLRIDSVLKESLEETQQVKKTSLTFAPEAGTQRMRDVINKGVTESDLLEKVRDAFEGGWSSVKLYFMDGLPTETDEDLDGIADLARKVVEEYFRVPRERRAKGLRVTVSASTFVPKPFTPFQWAAQDTIPEIIRKQDHLKKVLNIKGVNFNWHEPYVSFLEACVSRGDRRIGRVLLTAYRLGCILDGWTETFRFDTWMEAFKACGLDPAFYANRERGRDEILPWDHIDSGITKQFLWHEKEKSEQAVTTKDCRKGCNGCGLRRWKGYADMRILAVFEKSERIRHIGHLDIQRSMQRGLRRSGLPVAYSNGFNPHILITFASALSTGACGQREIMDVTMAEPTDAEVFLEKMNRAMPPELHLKEARAVDDRHPALMGSLRAASYDLMVYDPQEAALLNSAIPLMMSQPSIPAMRKTKTALKECDIKPLIYSLSGNGQHIRAMLALTEKEACKPGMLMEALSGAAGLKEPVRFLTTRTGLFGENTEGNLAPLELL